MRRIAVLSVGNFFAAGQFFLVLYVLAPYLATVVPAAVSGLAISLGAVITLSLFPSIPTAVRRFGSQKLVIALALFQVALMVVLALQPHALLAVLLIALTCATAPFIAYQLDLLLESSIDDENQTGRIRTLFLTAGNTALVLSPIVTGFLLKEGEAYATVFLISGSLLLPFIVLIWREKFSPPPPITGHHDLFSASRCIMGDKDLCAVALSYGVIQFFFHLVPLYIPLYLHTVLGFPWSELGWMFALMLIPFVLLEYPAGWLADTKFGDKRIMAAGFVIAGLSLAAVGFITATTPVISILAILMLTRVGAALVEATTEGHFFRRVSANDTQSVSLFRMLRPVGALIAPIVASLLLVTGSYTVFFAITGLMVLVGGLLTSLRINDVRPVTHTNAFDAPPYPPQGAPKARA